ncbi:DHA2 family efflux MFS transporter permease subunit [Acetobacteraceae bacterium KSS12]|uniref:DHA2 family efflux MFS transporter permease subunit n=2 Tax=Rhizosaccharibacter radicis TaxID=2782605 RepID=A0ABT1W088_9PROT|nr:DHA2 family efflux MFS transporter permease subunit [Acetobacteraceae bacterium KSS12]
MFMEQLDATVLTTALPTMARSFGVDPLHMSVALTSYLVSLSVLIPASGRVADRIGSRTVFTLAIVLFTLGSILCGLSRSLGFLVGARLLQGAGGALMVPVGRLVLLRAVPKAQLVSAMAWVLLPATIGPLIGPPLGGFLTTFLSWRWIFYINIPAGLLGLALAWRFIPQMRAEEPAPFDGIGMVLSGVALAGLVFGLELATHRGAPLPVTLAVLAAGLAAGALYAVHSRRVRDPILDFGLLRYQTFRLSLMSGSATRIMIGAMPFLIPTMLQVGLGASAAQSGTVTLATTVGSIPMRLVARRILRQAGFRRVMVLNGSSACGVMILCALFRPGMSFWLLALVLALSGFTQSLQFMALNTIAYDEVPPERMSAATSFYTTFQQLALTLGIAAAAATLAASQTFHGRHALAMVDFSTCFVVVGLVSLLAVPGAMRLPADAGSTISGHRAGGRGDSGRGDGSRGDDGGVGEASPGDIGRHDDAERPDDFGPDEVAISPAAMPVGERVPAPERTTGG